MAVGNPISLTDNVASRIVSQIATESQTDFTISGGYRINAISVYRNGVRLVSGRDYSAADGSTVVLLSGASLSDVLEFHIFDDFRVADAIVSNASYQNIEGNLNIAGILTVTTLNLSSLSVTDSISIGGTLTYNDVTNVDSIGIITARTDLHVGAGLSVVGVSTLSGSVDLGSNGNTDTITATGRFDSDLVPSNDDERDIGSSSLKWRDLYIDGTGNIDTLVSGDGTFSTNLGIGTANPTNYGGAVKLALSSGGHTGLTIAAGTSSDSNIFFADGTAGDATYRGNIKYAHDGDSMRFSTAAEERLRITSGGSVGIGTTNPTSDFDVHRSGSASAIIDAKAGDGLLTLRNAGNGNWSGINFTRERSTGTNIIGGSIWMPSITANNSALLYIQTQSASANAGQSGALTDNNGVRLKLASQPGGSGPNSAFTVEVGSTEKFRVTADGNVGVGETSPDVRLHVKEQFDTAYSLANVANEANHLLKLENPSTTANAFAGMQFRVGSGADLFFGAIQQSLNDGDFFFANQNSPNKEIMRIKSSGQVGIGTDNPQEKLHVLGTSDFVVDTEASGLRFGSYGEYDIALVTGRNTSSGSSRLYIENGDGEALRITSGGNIGIGTVNPDFGLHVYGAGDILIEDSANGSAHLRLRSSNNGTDVSNWKIKTGSNNFLYIENDTAGGPSQFTIDNSGKIGVNDPTPSVSLDLASTTDAVALPQGTTAQRPSGSSPYIRYNTTNSALEFYNGTDWVEIITDYFPTGSTILG